MRILITNDDGFDAPGLKALYHVAAKFGTPVVIAPDKPMSLVSHVISNNRPVTIEKCSHGLFGEYYRCSGSPADCVRIGLDHLFIGTIDWVLAGINRGGNVGVDTFYSGTVAAAREAAFRGFFSVAISQLVRTTWQEQWDRSSDWAEAALREVVGDTTAKAARHLVNINLPDPAPGSTLKGIKSAPLDLQPIPGTYRVEDMPADGCKEMTFIMDYFARSAASGHDVQWLFDDWITVSHVSL